MNFLEVIHKKIMNLPALKKMLGLWRFKDQEIVFTNGCFDIIHQGHIHLLTTARSFGNKLIVGLNTDTSVKRLKPNRPVQDELSRSLIMASLEFVDAVILFNEDTPYELIKEIQPDVLVKGGDYKIEEVVGRDIVEAKGGVVKLVELLPGFSTTSIIQRMS